MNKTTFILNLQLDSMSHLGAPRGQRGDEILALVVIHPEQRLPVLPHHPEVDLGLQVDVLHHVSHDHCYWTLFVVSIIHGMIGA